MASATACVTVKSAGDGVELHAMSSGQRVVLRLETRAALTLADQITMVCFGEEPATVAA